MPNTVKLHRVLRAAPDRVYRAFIDPDAMAAATAHGIQFGVRPTSGRPRADDLNEPALVQSRQHLRRGDLRQPGQLAEPRSRQRTVLEQQVERASVVELPEQTGNAGTTRHEHSLRR